MTAAQPASSEAAAGAAAGFAERVIAWQRTNGRRDLPWQRTRDPYRVWLSEIMLQQTQVATVLGYYARFLERFPDVHALAAAPQDDVLALWSGLGYYARARNLHRCAQVVVSGHGGRFPATAQGLAALPGIGRSTAAAIAAFCFGERAAILDGNVKRVLARLLAWEGDLATAGGQRELWAHAQALLPAAADAATLHESMAAYTQGLMDLGATVCTLRAPACDACPAAALCRAAAQGDPERYPARSRRPRRTSRSAALLWVRHGDRVWLVRRPGVGVWAGLWSLPEFPDEQALEAATGRWPGYPEWLPPFRHVLTHFDWHLQPVRLDWHERPGPVLQAELDSLPAIAGTPSVPPGGRWARPAEWAALGLPAPIRKLLQD